LEVLPDGLKSIISWLADLCMRLEDLDWLDDTPVFDRNIILFLDEIENHLHIKWQRKVLPVVQKLLPNAQIFVTTHSPFIINSVDDAFVYKLSINPATNFSVVAPAKATNSGNSYITELLQILEVEEEYGLETQQKLDDFYKIVSQIRKNEPINETQFMALANELAAESDSLYADIHIQLRKLSKETQHAY
jgi:predicted ATP-binding protein involved in virulence